MSFLPSVECGKFKLKQAFKSGKNFVVNKSYVFLAFLPSVECGKFKLKQAFKSGKNLLACSKKSEICATSTLKLIKMMLKCQVTQASSTCMLY